jgi:hypothetical protein
MRVQEDIVAHIIKWDNEEKTVVLQQYTDHATKDDLYEMAAESARMLSTCEHTVHLIIDERTMAFSLNSADMAYLEKRVPPNQGVVVLVVHPENMHYKDVIQGVGTRVAPHAFDNQFKVTSLEEARALLQEKFGVAYPS